MSAYFVGYDLQHGYVHNWLVAGPQSIPIPDLTRFRGADLKRQVMRHYRKKRPGIGPPPVEWGTFSAGGQEFTWRYWRCLDDHLVDHSDYYPTCHFLRSWAYTRLVSPSSQEVTFIVTTDGAADLWLNRWHVHRQEHTNEPAPSGVSFPVTLEQGHNEILVRFEQVAVRACPYAMALRIVGFSAVDSSKERPVRLPTSIEDVTRRAKFERIFGAAYLDQDVYAEDDLIVARWPEQVEDSARSAIRLQTPAGRIYAESHRDDVPGDVAKLSFAYQIPEGPYQVLFMPRPEEYYDKGMRVRRTVNLWSLRGRYSQAPYGSYQERCLEALHDAARRASGIFSEVAKMALDRWSEVSLDAIMDAVERINRREDGSAGLLLGLLGIMHRYRSHPDFSPALESPMQTCVLDYKYWMDEPGSDAMDFTSEHRQIMFHACEILAGQLFLDRTFNNISENGQWHREKGERMAISWLQKRGSGGFRDWDANCFFQDNLLALLHLVDFAAATRVWELAAVLIDKMFFSLALNSYRGVFGSTHGQTYAPMIKGGRLESTSGIERLAWGMGAFNHHVRGTVGLACANEYELPSIISDIAADLPEEMWNRERQAGELEEWCDGDTGTWEVNKATYKTPDYMLCSAQDYRPGERGAQEHIWQATLGPDAVVFVNHPPCMSESDARQPNFWRGNVVLPRVAQWRDVLIALHKIPEDDWLGFTHAYFPLHAFDEHVLRDGAYGHPWAFARKGAGYLALTAALGLELITRGDSAYRELRSYGQGNAWLCHMGRAALDGSFGEFQDRVLALELDFEGLSVRCATLRGVSLAFGWEGPLLVEGREQSITGFKHYENPYCEADWPVSLMDIRFRDQLLRLEFDS